MAALGMEDTLPFIQHLVRVGAFVTPRDTVSHSTVHRAKTISFSKEVGTCHAASLP